MTKIELETEVLMLLASRGELPGLEIMKLLNTKLGKNWLGFNKVGFGNLYPALYRLEEAGNISRRMEETEGMKYRKAFYKITYKGGKVLDEYNFGNFVIN